MSTAMLTVNHCALRWGHVVPRLGVQRPLLAGVMLSPWVVLPSSSVVLTPSSSVILPSSCSVILPSSCSVILPSSSSAIVLALHHMTILTAGQVVETSASAAVASTPHHVACGMLVSLRLGGVGVVAGVVVEVGCGSALAGPELHVLQLLLGVAHQLVGQPLALQLLRLKLLCQAVLVCCQLRAGVTLRCEVKPEHLCLWMNKNTL